MPGQWLLISILSPNVGRGSTEADAMGCLIGRGGWHIRDGFLEEVLLCIVSTEERFLDELSSRHKDRR